MNPISLEVGPEIDVDDLAAKVKELARSRRDGAGESADAGALREALRSQAEFNRSLLELVGSVLGQLRTLRGDTEQQLKEVRGRLLRAERTLRSGTDRAAETGDPVGRTGVPPFDRFLFEQRFRGAPAAAGRWQRAYLNEFLGCEKVAVLNRGGEFVELLRQHGVTAVGVEADADTADDCRDRGLPVLRSDPLDYLERATPGSLDGVFAPHLVERLTPERLWQFAHLCATALEPGGVLVLETANVACPLAMRGFYLDPASTRPVPPELLRFVLEQASFEVRRCRFTTPVPDADRPEVLDAEEGAAPDSAAYQDYGVVAVRPVATPAAAAPRPDRPALNGLRNGVH